MAVVHTFRRSKPSAEKGSSDPRSVGKEKVSQLSSQNCNSGVKWMRGEGREENSVQSQSQASPDLEAALHLDEQRKRKESCFAYL